MFEDFEEIKRRCKEAELEFEEYDEDAMEIVGYGFSVFIPRGRNRRGLSINVDNEIVASQLLSVPFEKYRLIEGYEASWSPEEGIIECNLLELGTHNYRPYATANCKGIDLCNTPCVCEQLSDLSGRHGMAPYACGSITLKTAVRRCFCNSA